MYKELAVREKEYEYFTTGEIQNFTGVSAPYEEPLNPELVLESDKESLVESVARVMAKIKELGYIE